jgi:hypothetical protein
MLTRILHNSPDLYSWLKSLDLGFSKPQKQHILNLADALLTCEDEKTLAQLQRQFLEAPDASNMADFLRISDWDANWVRAALRKRQLSWIVAEAERLGVSKTIYINLDDSLGEKDKHTTHLEPVAWYHDHVESTKSKPCFKNGFCYLACTVRVGKLTATVDLRLYLREKTVRRLNRNRPAGQQLHFRSKNHLARMILEELHPWLPVGWDVFVQFDSWYASEKLIKYVRRQHWQVTCGLKSNRKLNGTGIDQLDHALRHKRYTHVNITAADGNQSTYFVRSLTGKLENVPDEVRVFFSRRHPGEKFPAYFMSTALTRTAQQALQGYQGRWSCEVVNFYLKTQLGLSDFRVQSYRAVDRYMVVVFLTWAYIEQRYETERSAQIKTYGDIIRRHRDEHALDWLTGALDMMSTTGDAQAVLQRYLRQMPQTS